MWLPNPVYERIPGFWILMGLLFGSLALYIGFDSEIMVIYAALGAGCVVRGIWVFATRMRYRDTGKQQAVSNEIELDQTGATHV